MTTEHRTVKVAEVSSAERALYLAIIRANRAVAAVRPAVPERRQRETPAPKPSTRRKP